MKKVLSLFLAVMMVASIVAMMPVFTVSAAEPSYDGDSLDPNTIISNNPNVAINTETLRAPTYANCNDNDKFGEFNDTYKKLFDGDFGSKAEGNLNGTAIFEFDTVASAIVTHYVIYTGNDNEKCNGRNPESWVLKASNDGENWTVIDTVTSTGLDEVNSTPYGYEVDTPGYYTKYQIAFTKSGSWCQVCELKLYTLNDLVKPEDAHVTSFKDTKNMIATFTYQNHGLKVGDTVSIEEISQDVTVTAVNGDTVEIRTLEMPINRSWISLSFAQNKKIVVPVSFANTETAIGFVQLRPNSADPMGKFDVRIIVETFKDYIKHFDSANITATVEYGNSEHREFKFDTTTVYQSIKAGNETLYPSAGCLYFGGVITGIPNGDYNVKATLTLTVDGQNTEIVLSQNGVDVSNPLDNPAKNTQEATKVDGLYIYILEEWSQGNGYSSESYGETVVAFGNGQTLSDFVGNKQDYNNNVTVIVNVNGTNYKITKFANDGNWFRPNIEDANVPILEGLEYNFTVYVFDANYKMVYYTNTVTHRATYTTKNTTDNRTKLNVELPGGLSTIDSSTLTNLTCSGQNSMFNNTTENVAQLFDKNTSDTKMGCHCNKGATITVTFNTSSAQTITYYTLYTGNDTAKNPARNPVSWKLYGKVDSNWVVLSEIGLTNDTVTGLEATNSTPYSYKVKNPQSCTEYKIEFVTASEKFQMNELVLHTGN